VPRNRDYWNALEAHIRTNPHDLYGMGSTHGANALRRLAKLIARHAKIHKSREDTIAYAHSKLADLHATGYIQALSPGACKGICELIAPIYDFNGWKPIEADELLTAGGDDAQPQVQLPRKH